MANGATKPATPAAVADALAHTVPPPADDESGDARIPPGTMVSDRYRISSVLGEGGMGVVYLAEHVLMRKEVAVKVLHAEMCEMPEVVARFEREAIAAAHIEHPNVAGATDFGRLDDGSCYLVLELLRGVSLRDEIAKGPIPLGRALRIMRGITSGVAAAHAKGIVHRDLKPENVMLVDRDGTADFVKVLDFGIAKVDTTVAAAPQAGINKVLTRVGAVFGTPEYMAPEQAVGDTVDARADLYSLGVMFLEMLTGKCPFQGNALSILRERILAVGPPDMSGVSDEVAKGIIARLLTREPDDRMQTATELVGSIESMLDERKGTSMPPPSSPSANAVTSFGDTKAIGGGDSVRPPAKKDPNAKRKWMIPVAFGSALLVMLGAFALVSALTKPKMTTSPSSASSSLSPTDSIAVEPAPIPTAQETASAEKEADPAPTASAASARATTPRGGGRPGTKRAPPKKSSGGLTIPPPKDWFKQ